MRAMYYEAFRQRPEIREVPDPVPPEDGVVLEVIATGLCRSDWHGWQGHDPDIRLPHVPGHELAGRVVAVGRDVKLWRGGENVTVPFVVGCGACAQCHSGNQQICDRQFQPGFTHWGSFAQYVQIFRADLNLIRLPDGVDFRTAASLGCRFATAFRGVVDQGRVSAGQWVAVHGCGGVGLSAIMIASALGASVIAVDVAQEKLELAKALGASYGVNGREVADVVSAVRDLSGGGVHLSMDALGHAETCLNSIRSLRKRGRHLQIGLMLADQSRPVVPMDEVIARELEIVGVHGMQAFRYEAMLAMIETGALDPLRMIRRALTLEEGVEALISMDAFREAGVMVIDRF